MARPLDPRLLRAARGSRNYIILSATLGVFGAILTAAQALLLATVIAAVASGAGSAAPQGARLVALALVFGARTALGWTTDRYSQRASIRVISELRRNGLRHLIEIGLEDSGTEASSHWGTLLGPGLDRMENYLSRYLPQLLLTATVTPMLLALIWWLDWIAGVTVLVTLPLVPFFMALVGWATQVAANKRLRSMQVLGDQVLDLIAGLNTLRALGRARAQTRRVSEVGREYQRATMGTLRVAFLSALVLESLTTLSVALVAVGIGLRLVYGELDLETGLAVLILAPEVYLPLRQVGVHYHASVDGLAAADQLFDLLARPVPGRGSAPAPDLRVGAIEVRGLRLEHPGRDLAAPRDLSFSLAPGQVLALTGPSGSGKSSVLLALLGFLRPAGGEITVGGADGPVDLASLDRTDWWRQISWVPQRPELGPGTIREQVRGDLPADLDESAALEAAAAASGLDQVLAELPDGWDTLVGQGGHGLSAGQRQRVSLARALLRETPLVILDEPTAHLDAGTEDRVLDALRTLRQQGRTVLLVAHRRALIELADIVIELPDPEVTS
jgi:ATP-binding cassette subfamily C protein CydD